jgi:hypothetical protein
VRFFSQADPDENFARELFQLFSTGLVKLNMDGSLKLDRYGIPLKTYNTKDIVSFGRAWTGFTKEKRHGNYEDLDWAHQTRLDPMTLSGTTADGPGITRDIFPKRGLDGTYIGDRYPLCTDVPKHPFLRIGAKYKLLGRSSSPKWHSDDIEWDGDDTIKRIVLNPDTSDLYGKLCDFAEGACNFSSVVTLSTNVACDGAECDVDTVRVVQVAPGVFYEHLRQPCVQLAFYEGGKKVFTGWDQNMNMCAHPKMPVAAPACCRDTIYDENRPNLDTSSWGYRTCEYSGERVTFDSATERCEALSADSYQCDPSRMSPPSLDQNHYDCGRDGLQDRRRVDNNEWRWTTTSCTTQVVVQKNGLMAIVHTPNKKPFYNSRGGRSLPLTAPHVSITNEENVPGYFTTMNYFNVHWQTDVFGDERYPAAEDNMCGNGACEIMNITSVGTVCLCNKTVTETPAFQQMPSRDEVLSQLRVGAFVPDMFDDVDHVRDPQTGDGNGVVAYHSEEASPFSSETIFEVTNEINEMIFLKNVISTVQVRWEASYCLVVLLYVSKMCARIQHRMELTLPYTHTHKQSSLYFSRLAAVVCLKSEIHLTLWTLSIRRYGMLTTRQKPFLIST